MSGEIRRLGVKVELNKEVTSALVKEMAPDILIMAIGAKPLILSIPGASQDNVVTGWDVLSGNAETGANEKSTFLDISGLVGDQLVTATIINNWGYYRIPEDRVVMIRFEVTSHTGATFIKLNTPTMKTI